MKEIFKDEIPVLSDSLFSIPSKNSFPEVEINGENDTFFHPKILSLRFPQHPKNELLLLNLDIAGISASGGSACSSGVEAASHVLANTTPDELGRSIRFSFSVANTTEQIDYVVATLCKIFDK